MKTSPQFLSPKTLEPGWHYDIPEEVYHSWDLCSNSRLSRIHDSSPAHMRYEVEHPEEPTDAMILGTATHFAILQPALFDTRYSRWDGPARNTKEGKLLWEEHQTVYAGKTHLKAADYDRCRSMASAVSENLDARAILESAGQLELSGIFDAYLGSEEMTLRCKMRIDKLAEEFEATVDVKTCRCAHPREFEREIYNRGYHRQGAFYLDGATILGSRADTHIIIAVEKEPPFATVVYRLKRDAIDLGMAELKKLKADYWQCLDSGEWPSYPEGLIEIGVPAWALKRED